MSIKDITVVIATFKSSEKIKNCLNSIDRQSKVLLMENSNDSGIKENIEKAAQLKSALPTNRELINKINTFGLHKI